MANKTATVLCPKCRAPAQRQTDRPCHWYRCSGCGHLFAGYLATKVPAPADEVERSALRVLLDLTDVRIVELKTMMQPLGEGSPAQTRIKGGLFELRTVRRQLADVLGEVDELHDDEHREDAEEAEAPDEAPGE